MVLREDRAFEGLTTKQLAYCEARMAGCNMSDAYREAYDVAGSSEQTIGRNAYAVESNAKVQAKLRQLLAERGPDTSLLPPITRDFVLNGIAVMAISSTKEPVQLRAWELLGKAIGLFDKNTTDDAPEPTTSADIDAEIKRRLRGILAPVVEGEARRVDPPAAPPRRQRQRKPRETPPPA
tara:strand:- start:259 stop:798 length:540 start_codon:yes stop_codon:yes gene_type:complete